MSDKIVLDLCAELCSHRKQLETELKELQARLDSAVDVIRDCHTNFKCDYFIKSYMEYFTISGATVEGSTGIATLIHNRESYERIKLTIYNMDNWLKQDSE